MAEGTNDPSIRDNSPEAMAADDIYAAQRIPTLRGPETPQQPEDNWQNRSIGMRCSSCMFYVPKSDNSLQMKGRCRRHAPTMSGYPVVFPTDWCGDHKLR